LFNLQAPARFRLKRQGGRKLWDDAAGLWALTQVVFAAASLAKAGALFVSAV